MQQYALIIGLILAFVFYVYLIFEILTQEVGQSFATWLLWGLLDTVTFISIWREGGNYSIVGLYVVGCLAIATSLAYKRKFNWTSFESFVGLLVVCCWLIMYFWGNTATTIAGSLAVLLASLPQIKDSWHKPEASTAKIWFGFLVVNILYFFGGISWQIKEILYPVACVMICGSLWILNSRIIKRV